MKPTDRKDASRALGAVATLAGLAGLALAQSQIATPVGTTSAGLQTYVNQYGLPSPSKAYLKALGSRLQTPGLERMTLTGSLSGSSGSGTAQMTWQAPGSLRLDRASALGQPLLYDITTGTVSGTAAAADADLLESLLDDTAEAFLYREQGDRFQGAYAHRFLGGLFRPAGTGSGAYNGPWHEIHEVTGISKAQPGAGLRHKLYVFDSVSKLPIRTLYSAGGKKVSTEFSNWTVQAGQAYPGKIARLENDVQVAAFTASLGSFVAAAADGLFSVTGR